MPETQKLRLPLVEQAQAQKHVTVNESLVRLDSATQLSLVDRDVTVPPGSPDDGDCFGVGIGATGAWAGEDGRIAVFSNGGWIFLDPSIGWQAWLESEGTRIQHDGVGWVTGTGAITANGAGFVHRTIEFDHVIAAGSSSSLTAVIPANTIVYGVTGRVLTDIGGVSSIDIGVAGATDRYGSGIGVVAGAWMRGMTGSPLSYYADTDLIVSAVGGSFSGSGTLRLAIHLAELTLPRA